MLQDLRHSLRNLTRQPVFALVATVSLAVGIGVNTAIFSVLDALLFRPPPLRNLDRAVVVHHRSPGYGDQGATFPAFQLYRERTDLFARSMAVSGARPLVLTDGARRDQVYAELVTANFFSMTDIRLVRGSGFSADADRTVGAPHVTILSHGFWTRRFDADASVVGSTLTINGQLFVVSGIADAGFTGLSAEVSTDMWIPLTAWAELVGESARLTSQEHWLTMVAELAPGVTLEQAQAAMAVAGQAFAPLEKQQTIVRAARGGLAATPTDAVVIAGAAFAIGFIVLALACTNVGNLLMARAAARQHEMSVRLALGSGRLRLLRLWIAESLLLCVSAGALGLVVASWLLSALAAFKPPTFVGQADAPSLALAFALDFRVFTFTLALAVATALTVGLLSGLQSTRRVTMASMKGTRGSDRRLAPGFNLRGSVIALQITLSTVLLIPCGLFVRNALEAAHADPGFDATNVLLLPISDDQAGVKVQKPDGFELDLAGRVHRLPGVVAATVMDPVPLWFGGNFAMYEIDGHGYQRVGLSRVGQHYFATMRIPLLTGRDFGPDDTATSPAVAVVNETFARRFWPSGNAVGQRMGRRDGPVEIIGIARDSKHVSLAERSQLWLYRPIAQSPSDNPGVSIAARTSGDPDAIRMAIEREVRALVPNWPGFQFRTLDEALHVQALLPRLAATLLGALGLFGLFLATLGIYGVMAYAVRERRQELGIRLALGAPTARLLGLVIRQGMVVCLAGAAVGIAIAVAAAQLIGSALYGVGSPDLLTCIAVPVMLLSIAFVACYLPARRVTEIDPWAVLRE